MAHSFCSALRVVTGSVRNDLTIYHTLNRRWYSLPKRVTGELSWTKNHQAKRGDEPLSLDELIGPSMANLKRCRYARASVLNKVYDACTTREELAKAEALLLAYRHSLSFPRASLPLVVVRACIRVGHPEKALHYARNKVQFGVFPGRRVYNVLMDACLERGFPKGAVAAFDLMLADEWAPDGMTYHIAAKASLQLELDRIATETANQTLDSAVDDEEVKDRSEESVEAGTADSKSELEAVKDDSEESPPRLDLTRVLEFSEQCRQLEPRLGTKTYRVLVTSLLNEGYTDEASDMLQSLEAENKLPKQTLFNLRLDLCTSTSDYEGAFSLLRTLSAHDNRELGMPTEGLPRLRQAIVETDDREHIDTLEKICAEIASAKSGASGVDPKFK